MPELNNLAPAPSEPEHTPEPDLRIAAARREDLPRLKEIARDVVRRDYAPFLGRGVADEFLDSGQSDGELESGLDRCFVLFCGDEPIGFAITDGSRLHALMIHPERQRRGHGSCLLAFVEARLFAHHERIELQSFKDNAKANRFYERHGWARTKAGMMDGSTVEIVSFVKEHPMLPENGTANGAGSLSRENSMETRVRRFFERYARVFNQSLAGDMDYEQMASLYASEFIAASPAGVMTGKNDDQLKHAMAQGYEHYRAIGTKEMRVRRIRLSPLDDLHGVAHVAWTAIYARKEQAEAAIDFEVHYFVQTREGEPKVFGWVTGDEQALLKLHGIL